MTEGLLTRQVAFISKMNPKEGRKILTMGETAVTGSEVIAIAKKTYSYRVKKFAGRTLKPLLNDGDTADRTPTTECVINTKAFKRVSLYGSYFALIGEEVFFIAWRHEVKTFDTRI